MNKLVLIDGNSLINRAFYATPPLSTKDGTPTNAVYSFVNMLVKLIGDAKPEYILVAIGTSRLFATLHTPTIKPPENLCPKIFVRK